MNSKVLLCVGTDFVRDGTLVSLLLARIDEYDSVGNFVSPCRAANMSTNLCLGVLSRQARNVERRIE
jgi:hypothetical protein